jgi:hypothetical protein
MTPCAIIGSKILYERAAPVFMNLRGHENMKSDRRVCNLCEESTQFDFILNSYNTFKKILEYFIFSSFFP